MVVDLLQILEGVASDPLLYSLIFFVYSVLAAVILPIPVEVGLFNPNVHPALLIGVLALGKGVGAFIVFFIGGGIRSLTRKRHHRDTWFTKLVGRLEGFVRKYGNIGLLVVMSIPLMVDTVVLYLFSLLNPKESPLNATKFVAINILAGVIRGSIIIGIAYAFGIRLL